MATRAGRVWDEIAPKLLDARRGAPPFGGCHANHSNRCSALHPHPRCGHDPGSGYGDADHARAATAPARRTSAVRLERGRDHGDRHACGDRACAGRGAGSHPELVDRVLRGPRGPGEHERSRRHGLRCRARPGSAYDVGPRTPRIREHLGARRERRCGDDRPGSVPGRRVGDPRSAPLALPDAERSALRHRAERGVRSRPRSRGMGRRDRRRRHDRRPRLRVRRHPPGPRRQGVIDVGRGDLDRGRRLLAR